MLETHCASSLFVVLLNDIGFGQIRCYRSLDQTLRFDRLIRCGLSGTNANGGAWLVSLAPPSHRSRWLFCKPQLLGEVHHG